MLMKTALECIKIILHFCSFCFFFCFFFSISWVSTFFPTAVRRKIEMKIRCLLSAASVRSECKSLCSLSRFLALLIALFFFFFVFVEEFATLRESIAYFHPRVGLIPGGKKRRKDSRIFESYFRRWFSSLTHLPSHSLAAPPWLFVFLQPPNYPLERVFFPFLLAFGKFSLTRISSLGARSFLF